MFSLSLSLTLALALALSPWKISLETQHFSSARMTFKSTDKTNQWQGEWDYHTSHKTTAIVPKIRNRVPLPESLSNNTVALLGKKKGRKIPGMKTTQPLSYAVHLFGFPTSLQTHSCSTLVQSTLILLQNTHGPSMSENKQKSHQEEIR